MRNLVLSAALVLLSFPVLADCFRTCRESDAGMTFIRNFEGYFPFIYKDVAGKPTIGFGHLILKGEKFKQPLMGPDAELLLRADIAPAESAVNKYVNVSLQQHQFDALGSFTFNLGAGTFYNSSLRRAVNSRNPDVTELFLRYGNARVDGKLVPVKGLVRRRLKEANMYNSVD